MFKKINAIISYNESPYFPFLLSWTIGKCKYMSVFATKEDAINYINSYYRRIKIIDKTN